VRSRQQRCARLVLRLHAFLHGNGLVLDVRR
jgi:hypothetical protein